MVDLRTEMTSYLTKLDGGNPDVQQDEPKNEPDKGTDADDKGQQDSDSAEKEDTSEKDTSDTDKEDKVEDKKEDKESDKKEDSKDQKDKKPNRYQRLKVQRDEAVAESAKYKGEFYKAIKVANAWRAEALTFEKELKTLEAEAESTGFKRSNEKKQLFDYERERVGRQVEDEFNTKLKQESTQEQAKAFVSQLKEKFADEASDLGEKYGVEPKKILVALHAYRSTGENLSMEDVAKELGEISAARKRKKLENEQLDVNSGAPKPTKAGKGINVDYPATPEGMARYLKASGLA